MYLHGRLRTIAILLLVALTFGCGKQKEAPQKANPSTDEAKTTSNATSKADTPGTEQEQANHDTAEQEKTTSESEQEATFKVGGMVTRLGMV